MRPSRLLKRLVVSSRPVAFDLLQRNEQLRSSQARRSAACREQGRSAERSHRVFATVASPSPSFSRLISHSSATARKLLCRSIIALNLRSYFFESWIDPIMDLSAQLGRARRASASEIIGQGPTVIAFCWPIKPITKLPALPASRRNRKIEPLAVEDLVVLFASLEILDRSDSQFHVRAFRSGARAPWSFRRNMYGTKGPQFALPKPTHVSTNPDLGERLWGNKRRKSMPLADFDGRRRTLVLGSPEEA